jgi:uncharacterized membrane protein YdbT with pleckstrin-like domain
MPNEQYLGYKTFIIFCLKRSVLFLGVLFLAIVLIIISVQPFAIALSGTLKKVSIYAFLLAFVLGIILFLKSWLEYISYRFILDDTALIIKRGFWQRREIAIPYRQIQDIVFNQDFIGRILKLSELIILTTGDQLEDVDKQIGKLLPPIDTKLAEKLRQELLNRIGAINVYN